MISRRSFLKRAIVAIAGAACLGVPKVNNAPKKKVSAVDPLLKAECKLGVQPAMPYDVAPTPLRAKFTTAALEDLSRAHGLNVEEELVKQLGADLAYEVDSLALNAIMSPIFPSMALSEVALVQPLDGKEKQTLRTC